MSNRHVAAAAVAIALPAGTLAAGTRPPAEPNRVDVLAFADPATPIGWSTLQRGDDGVLGTFVSEEFPAGHAVTLWWIVFNEPDDCSAPGCGEDDIFAGGDPATGLDAEAIAAADVVAGFAAGSVATPDGYLAMSAGIDVDELGPETIFGEGAVLKALDAEIHLVARSHGPAVEGVVDVQTTSYAGGCETLLLPGDTPDDEGECAEIQFAVHQP
jgi:hypothetical protein